MRPSLKYVKENLKGDLVIAEIGVLRGQFSEELLKELPIRKIYLIDPYTSYFAVETGCFHDYPEIHNDYLDMKKRLEQFDGKVEVIRRSSCVAANEILKDILFDFVYIDACHQHFFVKEDLKYWFPLVKDGGVFAGHDCKYGDVANSIRDFSSQNNLKYFTEEDDWIIQKNSINLTK